MRHWLFWYLWTLLQSHMEGHILTFAEKNIQPGGRLMATPSWTLYCKVRVASQTFLNLVTRSLTYIVFYYFICQWNWLCLLTSYAHFWHYHHPHLLYAMPGLQCSLNLASQNPSMQTDPTILLWFHSYLINFHLTHILLCRYFWKNK